MRVWVNLYRASGKWAYGGAVEVDESIPMFDPRHLQDLVDGQDFVVDGTFDDHYVVVSHGEDYDTDTSQYFCQALYVPGRFTDLRKSDRARAPGTDDIIRYRLIRTNRRLTLDIEWQREDTRWRGEDDGGYPTFRASNGYEVISRSRMDIQTERVWLLGASPEERSGTMVFSSNEKRDRAYAEFTKALDEWAALVRAGGWMAGGG